jgi:hypothetical protein
MHRPSSNLKGHATSTGSAGYAENSDLLWLRWESSKLCVFFLLHLGLFSPIGITHVYTPHADSRTEQTQGGRLCNCAARDGRIVYSLSVNEGAFFVLVDDLCHPCLSVLFEGIHPLLPKLHRQGLEVSIVYVHPWKCSFALRVLARNAQTYLLVLRYPLH